MNLTIKDAALVMTKLSKKSIGISTRQLNRNIKKILKPPKKAQKSLNKVGINKALKCQHKKTVAINEEGHAGVFCVDCGEQIEKEC